MWRRIGKHLFQIDLPAVVALVISRIHPALEGGEHDVSDVGIERLSTNLVCERAGLTPPALYRYFPNKYALLSELGQRLMQQVAHARRLHLEADRTDVFEHLHHDRVCQPRLVE